MNETFCIFTALIKTRRRVYSDFEPYQSGKVVGVKLRHAGQDATAVAEDVLLAGLPLPLAAGGGKA